MIYSIIDIGTNSVRFLLAEYNKGNINIIRSEKATTRLGEGLYTPQRRLCDKPVDDTVYAVKKYVDISRLQAADKIICVATSAVRDASNSAEFAQLLNKCTGITLNILSGEEEARCGFVGAMGTLDSGFDTMLIDIGGGSTELVRNTGHGINGVSFECGCVRLRELFKNDYASAHKYIADTLTIPRCQSIVWIGGTATAAAMIYKGIPSYSHAAVHMTTVPGEYICSLAESLPTMTSEQLHDICSFDARRSEILPYGFMIMSYIIKRSGARQISISENGLMEGIMILSENNI